MKFAYVTLLLAYLGLAAADPSRDVLGAMARAGKNTASLRAGLSKLHEFSSKRRSVVRSEHVGG